MELELHVSRNMPIDEKHNGTGHHFCWEHLEKYDHLTKH